MNTGKGTKFRNVYTGNEWFVRTVTSDEDVDQYLSETGRDSDSLEIYPIGWNSNEW